MTESAPQKAPANSRRVGPPVAALAIATLMGGAGAGFGYWLANSGMQTPWIAAWLRANGQGLNIWDLLALPVLTVLAIGAHELGHLTGGMLRGMRFLLLIFGPFQWYATPAGTRFKFVTNLGLMGGLAAALPKTRDTNLQRQLIALIVGGPLASVLLTLLAVLVMVSFPGRAAVYAAVTAILSLGIFLITAAPFKAGGLMSDGMQLIEVLRGKKAVEERIALLNLVSQSIAGIRPRDWDADMVATAREFRSEFPMRQIASWAQLLYRAMDEKDQPAIDDLAQKLAGSIDEYPNGFRQSIATELSLVSSLKSQLAEASAWAAKMRGGIVDESRRELALAALASLRGNSHQAQQHARMASKSLPHAMDPGVAALTRDQLMQFAVTRAPSP
jgi:hypothetical protein